MINISQREFEEKVQQVIEGKTTRVKLIDELKTDRVTLNNKIQELVIHNPNLYKDFIEKFPYKPREYTHIDYEAIVIDILKRGYTRRELDDVYEGVSSRTIQRKIKEISKTNPKLIELYRKVSEYRKRQKPVPKELQGQIDELEEREIFIGEICDKRREELLEKEKQYQDAIIDGIGATEASKIVGSKRVSKAISTLNRIEIERQFNRNKPNKDEDGER